MTQIQPEPTIKLVVSDIDGTLLNSKLELSARTKQALQAAIDCGAQVILATGKTRAAGAYITDQLHLNSHSIYMQGLIVYDGEGQILYQQTLDPAICRQVITYAEDRGFGLIIYTASKMIIHRRDRSMIEWMRRYHEPEPEQVGALQNVVDATPINKIMAVGDPRAITGLRWQLNAQLGGSVRLMQAGLSNMLEILPPGASKGAALRVLLKQLQIPASQVMAIGDAENDIEMLQAAGVPVAVGNADPRLRAVAKHVVATNDEDGVADAIERFVIHRKLEPPADTAPLPTPDAPVSSDAIAPPTAETETAATIESQPNQVEVQP